MMHRYYSRVMKAILNHHGLWSFTTSILLILPDFIPFVMAARVMGWWSVPTVHHINTVQQSVVRTMVIHSGPENTEVGLQGLQQLVHDITAGDGVIAEWIVLRAL